jgi:putative component of toxin-antitoxin plasmid stabilization module
MHKFTLKTIEAIKGKQVFEELVIDATSKDELKIKGQLTEFARQLEGTSYHSEYKTILAYMSFVSELKSLPQSKFKDITPEKEEIKEYEFKSKHLRIYCIKKPNGKIVVLGGQKSNQKSDIIKFRSIKKQYLESLK